MPTHPSRTDRSGTRPCPCLVRCRIAGLGGHVPIRGEIAPPPLRGTHRRTSVQGSLCDNRRAGCKFLGQAGCTAPSAMGSLPTDGGTRATDRGSASVLGKPNGNPAAWVRKYTENGGWFRVDQAHRQMETFITSMEEDPESEKPIGVLRREYEDLLLQMTEGFSNLSGRRNGLSPASFLNQGYTWISSCPPGNRRPISW